jgi:hypothetical protein
VGEAWRKATEEEESLRELCGKKERPGCSRGGGESDLKRQSKNSPHRTALSTSRKPPQETGAHPEEQKRPGLPADVPFTHLDAAAVKPGIAAPEVAKRSIEEETWNEINHDLVRLKKDPVARELEQKYENRKTQIYLKGQTRATAWTVPLEMSRLWIEQTKEWIESLNQIYGQVWERQDKVKTPSFVRAVFQKALLPAIETGIAAVKEALNCSSLREHSDDLTSLQVEDIVLEVSQLRHEWQTRIEIKAIELQLEQERLEAQQPVPTAAADVPRGPDAANVAASRPRRADAADPKEKLSLSTWDTVEISFLSDERVQICNGASSETRNYSELRFEDHRNGKPNQAWVTLRHLAEARGIMVDPAKTGGCWPKVEKRMQEIRKALRHHFGISADPVPFIPGTGYQARLKIGCAPSFHT